MEPIFLIIVGILMLLAVSDLIVGVSNDAVNFLNSAVGSRAASRRVIMTVASVGIMAGVLTSSGMMEIARSGVFNPGMFTFKEVMFLFLAVMLTDVILLDLFNTIGIPTSTTVSLIFELLGAAVAISVFSIVRSDIYTIADINSFINSSKSLVIISGILSSVIIAFICGSVIMYITRLLFTFNFKKKIKGLGTIWSAIALTAITYFAIFKGLKGAPFIPADLMTNVDENILIYFSGAFVFWIILMFFLQLVKVNVLKITVLAGTFALALAFAGNDLVNFIGVFMAGYDSYNIASLAGDVNMNMGILTEPVKANIIVLMVSGIVMILTLWFSKKAKKVTETEINLSKEDDSYERFGSTSISRSIVRATVNFAQYIDNYTPARVKNFINSRFEPVIAARKENGPAFDLIRATVNLTVAALLISLATSLKLPLSTTYVTFMVAMGTSIADRAWGRENAVYKITGVLTVIAGWFLTGVFAFAIAFLIAAFLVWAKTVAVIILTLLCGYILYRSNFKKKKTVRNSEDKEEELYTIKRLYNNIIEGIVSEDRKALRNVFSDADEQYRAASERKNNIVSTIKRMKDTDIDTSYFYVQRVDYICEITKALRIISKNTYEHLNNNHKGFSQDQLVDIRHIDNKVNEFISKTDELMKGGNYTMDSVLNMTDEFLADVTHVIKNQIKRNKNSIDTTRSSILFLSFVNESKTMVLQLRNVLKAYKNYMDRKKH